MGLIHRARRKGEAARTADDEAADFDEAIRLATEECLSHGVTTFHDAGESFGTIDRFKQLAARGELAVRLCVMIGESNDALAERLPEYRIVGFGNHHLTVRAIKRFIDGALGVHGAWLLEPYDDLPESRGLNTTPVDSIRRTARLAAEHGFQLCVHAIGDRANRVTLDVFEEVFKEHPAKTDLRWRIEHAQHLDPADVPRFERLEVIASMQGVHATSDAPFVVERLGTERARTGAYAWRTLLESGAVISNGTDAPVEDVDPIQCFYASVTRRLADGTTFFPEQRMTRREALRSYTIDAAYAAFEEDLKGSLTPGKLADVVVLSHDIMTVPEKEILQTRVLYTIVGGKVLYEPTGGANMVPTLPRGNPMLATLRVAAAPAATIARCRER
jgi:predicted amidohydrolase YtcJ